MGMEQIFSQIKKFAKITNDYFNPIGKFYLKYTLLTRVVFFTQLLKDIVTTDIICDTKQFACEDMCRNRFSPIRMEKIYTLELFWSLSATGLFVFVAIANSRLMRQGKVTAKRVTTFQRYTKKLTNREENFFREEKSKHTGKTIVKSKLTSAGYIMMLVIRLSGELVFITAERELAKHQSGVQCGFLDYSVFL